MRKLRIKNPRLLVSLAVIGMTAGPTSASAAAGTVSSDSLITVRLHDARNMSAADRAKLDEILALFERVVNSDEFRQGVLNFETCETLQKGECVSSRQGFYFRNSERNFTNEEVLKHILEGTENYTKEPRYNPPPANGVADLFLKTYWSRKKVIGYTYPGRRRVYLNERYLDSGSQGYIAGNLVHEWMHKLGFKHSSYRTRLRAFSVPYGVGNLVRKIASEWSGESPESGIRAERADSTGEEMASTGE